MSNKNNSDECQKNNCVKSSGCSSKSVLAGCFDAKTDVSRINFHVKIKHLCKNSKYGIFIEIYFTPKCGERYLAGVVSKAINVRAYCEGCKYSECCDEIVVSFKNVVVNVSNCKDGCFDIKIYGNYLSFEECEESEDYCECQHLQESKESIECSESEGCHKYEEYEE